MKYISQIEQTSAGLNTLRLSTEISDPFPFTEFSLFWDAEFNVSYRIDKCVRQDNTDEFHKLFCEAVIDPFVRDVMNSTESAKNCATIETS